MITLAIFNFIIARLDYLLTHALYPLYVHVSDLGTSISALQVPASVYSVLSLTFYFLPMGTIFTLFTITIGLVVILCLSAFIFVFIDIVKLVLKFKL